MDRREFFRAALATAGGLVLPYEPERVYSFASTLRVPGQLGVIAWDGQADFLGSDDAGNTWSFLTAGPGVELDYSPG